MRDYHQIKHSYFVYPDERSLAGSTAAFIALHHVLLASGKVAICSHTRVDGAKPALVALCPQKELVGSDDLQVRCRRWPEEGAVWIRALQLPKTRSAAQACMRSPQVVVRNPLVAAWANIGHQLTLSGACPGFAEMLHVHSHTCVSWAECRAAASESWHPAGLSGCSAAAPLLRQRFKL